MIAFYFWNHDWSDERLAQMDKLLARGGGIVALHSATIADRDTEKLARRIGLAATVPPTKYRHGPIDLAITHENHPITGGLRKPHFYDETYWPMVGPIQGSTGEIEILATAEEEGESRPMIWTYQPMIEGKIVPGRVFCSILGHFTWTYDDPLFRMMILRGFAWAAGENPSRFDSLITEGITLRSEP